MQHKQTVTQAATTTAKVRRMTSDELLAGEQRVLIQHLGQDYLLQLTRQGKLILTK